MKEKEKTLRLKEPGKIGLEELAILLKELKEKSQGIAERSPKASSYTYGRIAYCAEELLRLLESLLASKSEDVQLKKGQIIYRCPECNSAGLAWGSQNQWCMVCGFFPIPFLTE